MVGGFYGVLLLSAKHSRSRLMGRHLTNGDSANHSKDHKFRLEQWSNIPLFLPKTCRDCISSARTFMYYNRGEIWEGDSMVADIEELEQMDASGIHAGRLNAKEVFTPTNGETFIFPIADGTVQFSGGDQVLRTSTLIPDHPDRGEKQ